MGWIDLNGNGTFDVAERVVVPVPAGSGTANYTLNFPAGTFAGTTVARFRLFPGTVAAPAPTGAAAGGEVEDYPVTVAGTPIFLGCSDLVTFDTGNENWRAATTDNGTTVILAPQPVEWGAAAGNPGGAVIEDDLDGNWTELWTPVLGANGFTSDYSFALGQMLQFDYRNNTGISYNIYVAIRGVNGDFVYFNFRPQIVTSTQWNRIRVPMDASLWLNGFNNAPVRSVRRRRLPTSPRSWPTSTASPSRSRARAAPTAPRSTTSASRVTTSVTLRRATTRR